ncbi:MAG TPA: rhomboid family intramembrane serine protease [Rhabdochlamydiaceae bacterium]|nr:rhomboid family intramembrane serine protease [Rhabdochlamydiaceae bacterium]
MVLLIRQQSLTLILIALNLIVYILMVVSGVNFFLPTAADVLAWGGCSDATLLSGEPWRLVTAMFVHFGILHLLMNLYALYDLGKTLEVIVGKARFILAYLVTGIFGGLVSQVWHLGTYSVEAGASGGVFGIIGVLIALLTTKLFPEEVRMPSLKRILGMVAVNLVYGMQATVNMAAHMGGLVSGFILGYALYWTMVQEGKLFKQALFFVVPLITLVSVSGTLSHMRGSDSVKFDEIVSQVERLQAEGEKIKDQVPWNERRVSKFLTTHMIPVWEKQKHLTAQAREMNLSGNKAKYRDYLEKSVELQASKLQALIFKIEALERNEEVHLYQNMIDQVEKQITQLNAENYKTD